MKQPLLLAISGYKKEIEKETGKVIRKTEYCYLVPELVSFTGMTESQIKSRTTMSDVANYTRHEPSERMKKCS